MRDTPSNNGEKQVKRNEKGQIMPGSAALNPEGKPPGTKHLSTLLFKALLERAKNKDGTLMDKTHADLLVEKVIKDAILYGKKTEMIFDRIEGQAKQELDLTTGGESINTGADVVAIAKEVAARLKEKKTG